MLRATSGELALTIGYTCLGNGPEHVLVMHDWNGDHTTYDATAAYLDGSAFTYAFVDLRGYGKSRDISGDYTVAEVAADCLAVVDELGWQRFHVMGHSMTGMATQRIALDAGSRVKSAIAVCPVSAAGLDKYGSKGLYGNYFAIQLHLAGAFENKVNLG